MIQRIQTIFLALAALSGFSLFLEPMDFALISNTQGGESIEPMLADGIFDIMDNPALMGLTVLLGLAPLVALFLFKNRKWQMNINRVAILAGIALLAVGGFLFYQSFEPIQETVQANASFGLAAPFLSFIFLFLANRYINKDEKLVRSADRLR